MPGKVDYDRIAPGYERRFAGGGQPGPARALRRLAAGLNAKRILEVGCGTGHWLAGLSAAGRRLYGLDLSAGMLLQAAGKPEPLHLVRGRAGRLPFPPASLDLIYCVNALHHFDQKQAFVGEARRLLRPDGALAVIGMDPRLDPGGWYIYDYFEGAHETDLARFPSWGTVLDWMVAAGFRRIEWQPVEEIHAAQVGRAVLRDPFLQKDATSQLTLLSDKAYAAGLARIESDLAAAEAAGETLVFATDLCLGLLVGRLAAGD